MSLTQGELFKQYIENKGITDTEVANKLNKSSEQISKYYETKRFQRPTLVKIKEVFKDFLVNDSEKYDAAKSKKYTEGSSGSRSVVAQSSAKYSKEEKQKTIPYYNVEATAGQLNVFNDEPEVPSYQISIPAFSDCDFAVNVAGNSMYPKFSSGDIIICKQLNNLSVIPLGEVYLIVTDEQRLVKYIRKSQNEDCFLLVSENSNYEPWDICKNDIRKIYLVKGKIQRNQI